MLTPQQKQAILDGKAQGLSKEQAFARAFAMSKPVQTPGSETMGDVVNTVKGVGSDLYQRGQNVMESFKAGARGEQNQFETAGQTVGNVLGGAFDIAGRAVVGAASLFTSQETEDAVSGKVNDLVQKSGVPEKFNELSPRTQRNVQAGIGLFEGLTLGSGSRLTKPFRDIFKRGTPEAPVASVDDVFKKADEGLKRQANDANLDPRAREEAARAQLTFQERYIGLEPDVKNRLQQMGPEKLQEYLDAVHRRNIDDTAPTPYEVGSQNVNSAVETLQKTLNDTGSGIGQTRRKLATVRVPQPSIERIESQFTKELDNLGLTIKNGNIVVKPGTIARTSAQSDVKVLQSLYKDLQTFKQSPTLKNAIDLRMVLDGKINFGKSARDVSNSVDPLSRSVRAAIASETAKVVGKSNATELQKYSDFMEAFGDLKSYTDRAAGGEYLLRLVLSGRGGDSRKLIETIKEYTGVDLMNDATAMKVATETLGNSNTQNLFKQDITKAGYDVATVLRGDTMGMLEIGARKLVELGIDPEDVLKKAAAGLGGYLLLSYVDSDGSLLAPGIAMIGAMSPNVRVNVINDAIKELDKQRGVLMKSGLKETHPRVKANEKSRILLERELAKTPLDEGAIPETTEAGWTGTESSRPSKVTNTSTSKKPTGKEDVSAPSRGTSVGFSGETRAASGADPLYEEARKYKSAEEFGLSLVNEFGFPDASSPGAKTVKLLVRPQSRYWKDSEITQSLQTLVNESNGAANSLKNATDPKVIAKRTAYRDANTRAYQWIKENEDLLKDKEQWAQIWK